MANMSKFAPSDGGVRDPRDAKKNNGMFKNFPRFLYFGGAAMGVKLDQSGSRKPDLSPGMSAVGPVSDRGKGRR